MFYSIADRPAGPYKGVWAVCRLQHDAGSYECLYPLQLTRQVIYRAICVVDFVLFGCYNECIKAFY